MRLTAPLLAPFAMAMTCVQPVAPTPQTADATSLTDEFDKSSSLSSWQRIEQTEGWNNNQLERFEIRDGWLTMMPYASTWYRDYRGILVYKPVSGDFVITTKLKVSGRRGGAPNSQFSLAGIMIRAPRNVKPSTWRPGGENYTFLSLGAADRPGSYQFEVKTTINSDSQLVMTPAPSGEAIIRVARIGSALIMMKNVGGQWTIHRRYSRPDFPGTLQAGLTCYTDWPTASQQQPPQHNSSVNRGGNPDLIAMFDYVRYTKPNVPANLAGKRLEDPSVVSDGQLLQFLGN